VTADVTVNVVGLAELTRTMRKAGKDISELKDAHTAAATIVAERASQLAPRRSGALAGSIRPAKQAARARVNVGGGRIKYANPIHWGWPARNIAPSLFLTDAAEQTKAEWLEQYERDIQQALDAVRGA
jgi:hypothetical protein